MRKIFTLLFSLNILGTLSIAQIPIKTEQDEEPEYENPMVGEDGELYSTGAIDTSDGRRFYIQPLGEITVQENRIQIPFAKQNRNIAILDQSLIRTLPVKSVNELLAYVAGVDVRQRGPWGTQADMGIDGGTFDQTLVLINGVKISDPQTGHNMMNMPLPLDAIERIEVLRGPAARIYGVNALNGAVNIITKKPAKTGITTNIYGGSNFHRDTDDHKLYAGYGLQLSASIVGDREQHLLSLSREQASGYRYNTAFANNKAYYQNNLELGNNNSLQMMGGIVHNDFGANAFYAAPGDKEANETLQTGLAAISANLKINPYWTLKPRVSYRYNHDDYIYTRLNPDAYHNRHETHVADAELNNVFATDIGDFGAGVEVRAEWIRSSNLGNWQRSNYGFFGEYSFNKVKDLLVNIGAYANYNSVFGWRVMPGIDAGYRIIGGLRLFANAGTGQRLPTYTDWYYQGPLNVGNPLLKPEYSYNAEGGIKYGTVNLNASASYFYRRTDGFIDWVKDTVTDPWQPQNFQQINTQGVSLNVDYRWRSNDGPKADVAIIAGLGYTFLSPKISNPNATDSVQPISRYALENLRHQLVARLNVEFLQKLNITLAARHVERVTYAAYTLVDARISYTLRRFSVYADVSNIGNVSYIETGAVPLPGRWATVGFKWAWWRR
ncbi:MAG: TonB-dependent receptor [Edaphocola sp.]